MLDLEPNSDAAVIGRIRGGEIDAFEVLMRRYNQRVYRAVRSILSDEDEVEDVMQEAYVRAFTHLADFEGRAAFSIWLVRIAVHEALARARKSRRFDPLSDADDDASASVDPEVNMSSKETRALLESAIDGLRGGFREVFVLRAVEELSTAEVAECLGIREETVKTRYFRAKEALRAALIERLEAGVNETFAFQRPRCDRVVGGVLERLSRSRLS
jgi:RNA polymerase sigma-70 factor (ECF subfamily)